MVSQHTTILFLSADPTNVSRLRLGEEVREIHERLQLAKYRDHFTFAERTSVRPRDITQAIFDTEPQIVHFAGHGTMEGELCFEDEAGQIKTIRPDALASLFELLSAQVKCVVLNACYSHAQALAIAKHVDYVVGMNAAIGDRAAIAFAVGFYKALAAGRPFEDAYDFGIVELKLMDIPEELTPVLVKKARRKLSHLALSSLDVIDREIHKGYSIFLGRGLLPDVILMDPRAYGTLRKLMDDLYINYLSKLWPPYTYGKEWLLIDNGSNPPQIIAPLTYVAHPGESVTTLSPNWASTTTPAQQGVVPGSYWNISSEIGSNLYGVAANNPKLVNWLFESPKAIHILSHKYLDRRPLSEVDTSRYRYRYVFKEWRESGLSGFIWVEKDDATIEGEWFL